MLVIIYYLKWSTTIFLFLVTIPIHDGSNEGSERAIRSSETTAKVQEQPYNRNKRKTHKTSISVRFCEKATKIALKTCFNVDLEIVLFVYKRM